LVILDLGLPGMSGMEGLAWLQARHPQVPVVVMSSADDQETVLRALDAGAMGFIPKSSASVVLRGALELVLAGGIYLPPSVFLPQRGGAVPPPAVKPVAEASLADPPACTPESLGLTHRQAEVLDLILQGHPAKSICRALDLAPGTVKTHTTAVLRALKVTNRTQAVVAASQLGWRLKR
jgi:DNA-binding NarL/FixJ family response regulator